MRLAALYDIHGNLPALEAVIDELGATGVDLVVVGGDVLPGPMPRESLEVLLDLRWPTQFIRGNGDRETLAMGTTGTSTAPEQVHEVLRWTAEQLSAVHEQHIRDWPLTLEKGLPNGGTALFCHATPRDDNEIFTRVTPAEPLEPVFGPIAPGPAICGHTHMQFDRTVGGTRVVNAGSVGMPFGEPGAHWLLIEDDRIQLRRTGYDLEAAAARIRRTTYPQAAAFASGNVLHPPTEADMMAALEKRALR